MKIDAHQHFWTPSTQTWLDESMSVIKREFWPEHLEPLLRAQGFDGSIAVQTLASVDETRLYLELAARHELIRGVVGWVDLCSADVGRAVAQLARDPKLVGIRHIAQSEPDDFLLRPDFQRGIAALGEIGLAYDILIYARQLPAALQLVEAFPDQRFVIDHIAKPEIKAGVRQPWGDLMHRMASYPNVVCKLSGMVTEADWQQWQPSDLSFYLDTALEEFGASRLMIGSDWPVCLLAGSYERVVGVVIDYVSRLSQVEQGSILGETAALFYGLDATRPR
jgi:L-fuconolactonase